MLYSPRKVVAPGRIALGRGPVVRRVALEAFDLPEELSGGGGIADVLEHVGFRADELVGLGQVGAAPVADDFLRDPAGKGVAGDAGERIRAAALKGEPQRAGRLGGAARGGDFRQPAFDECDRPRSLLLVAALDTVEGMEHMCERVAAPVHEPLHVVVGVRARTVVDREHRAHVGVHHEPREHSQQVVEIVRASGAAALGVGHRDHAVHCGRSHARGPLRDLAHESVGARRGGKHHDEIAGAHPAAARTAVAVEGRPGIGGLDLLARHERRFIQLVGLDGVQEVRARRKLEVDVALGKRGQDLLVADVLTGNEVTGRDSERESP